jgi:small-conductance mechanosensitive channel
MRLPIHKTFRSTPFLVLAAIFIICLILVWTTRDAMVHVTEVRRPGKEQSQSVLVQPWQTAVDLASLAVTAEEQRYAHAAETLADHEVHQAFQSALDQAQLDVQKRQRQPQAVRLAQVVEQRQQTVNQDQELIKAAQANADQAANDVDMLNAQLDLDTDELKDAQQALARNLDDRRTQLEQDLAAHEAAVKKYAADTAARGLGAVATSQHYGTVARRLTAYLDQRTRHQAIMQAAEQTDAAVALLTQHEAQLGKAPASAGADRVSRMDSMKKASMHKRMMLLSSDRIENQKQLADVYRKWAAQVQVQHAIVFHLLMQSLALLVFILLCALVLDSLIRYLFDGTDMTESALGRRHYSVRVILRLSVQVAGALLAGLLIFGPPDQVSTILGLATVGLTVVLQDFIISFCGWFVLMGKHGIRQRDWVEINGITGEVGDIGIFRTELLETGNWTDHGHPTGRRVTFPNSFAIKGQYFNFTTNGQWMWDELSVTVPAEEAYGTIELIHKAVLEETQAESQKAQEEWSLTGRANDLSRVSADASVNMRPAAGGIDIVVRYVTRAAARSTVRNLVYQRVLEVLHHPYETKAD